MIHVIMSFISCGCSYLLLSVWIKVISLLSLFHETWKSFAKAESYFAPHVNWAVLPLRTFIFSGGSTICVASTEYHQKKKMLYYAVLYCLWKDKNFFHNTLVSVIKIIDVLKTVSLYNITWSLVLLTNRYPLLINQ